MQFVFLLSLWNLFQLNKNIAYTFSLFMVLFNLLLAPLLKSSSRDFTLIMSVFNCKRLSYLLPLDAKIYYLNINSKRFMIMKFSEWESVKPRMALSDIRDGSSKLIFI